MKALIYARFSSSGQSKGTSIERQLEMAEDYCRQQGWQVAAVYEDKAESAFHGNNLSRGGLGEIEARALRGEFDGMSLVCENLDRLSRREAIDTFDWLRRVAEAGLSIITLDDRTTYDREFLRGPMAPFKVAQVLMMATANHKASADKSERILAAYSIKRRKAREGEKVKLPGRCPAWLVRDGKGGYLVNKARVETLNRIFDMAIAGYGRLRIAKALNGDGVEAWQSDGWHPRYISWLIQSDLVMGVYQPGSRTRKSGDRLKKVGEPIPGFYPVAVDADKVTKARAAMENRKRMSGRKSELRSIFSGLAHCYSCGGTMSYGRKANGAEYLQCHRARRGLCERKFRFDYRKLETGILDALLTRAFDDTHFSRPGEVAALEKRIAEQRFENDRLRQRRKNLTTLAADGDEEAIEQLATARSALATGEKFLAEMEEMLVQARGKVSPEEHRQRVHNIRSLIDDEDDETRLDARTRVMQALHAIVETMSFDGRKKRVAVKLVGGVETLVFDESGRQTDTFDFATWKTQDELVAGMPTIATRASMSSYLGRREAAGTLVKPAPDPELARAFREVREQHPND